VSCLAGRVTPSGAATFTQTRTGTVTYSCPDPWAAVVASSPVYTPWAPLESAACAPACVAPPTVNAPITRAAPPSTQSLACPAGQSGTWTQQRSRTENGTRTTTYVCPAPTGAYTTNPSTDAWLGTYNFTSPWVDTVNTCAPTCGPSPANGSRSLACPAGQSGTITQTHTWTSVPSPTCWAADSWSTVSNTCTPTVEVCSDGSQQVAAWYSADYPETPPMPSVPVINPDMAVALTPEERERYAYLQQYNPVTHTEWYPGSWGPPWPANTNDHSEYSETCSQLSDVGNVSYLYDVTFECVENMVCTTATTAAQQVACGSMYAVAPVCRI
jgi:hypothetical protein